MKDDKATPSAPAGSNASLWHKALIFFVIIIAWYGLSRAPIRR